jgi:formate dehydrogenase (coenzyme F420) beta subunit
MTPNQIAKELLESKKVSVVVGYSNGSISGKTQTLIARTPEQAAKFIFNKYCVNNLAIYLTKVYKLPKPIGLFVKGCDAKTIVGLIQEHQVKREDVYIIGLNCEGVTESLNGELLGKCRFCEVHTPKLFNVLSGEAISEKPFDVSEKFERLNQIEEMPVEQRWEFWMKEFDKCVRCYACRQACPLCYCEQCIVDKTQPRWIESSAHAVGNLSWHFIRAFHLAGRCIGCGECERVCHQNIPLGLLNMKMAKEIFELYGYKAGVDADAKPPLTDYKMEDDQHFIR